MTYGIASKAETVVIGNCTYDVIGVAQLNGGPVGVQISGTGPLPYVTELGASSDRAADLRADGIDPLDFLVDVAVTDCHQAHALALAELAPPPR